MTIDWFWAVCDKSRAVCVDDDNRALVFSSREAARKAAKQWAWDHDEIVRVDKVNVTDPEDAA